MSSFEDAFGDEQARQAAQQSMEAAKRSLAEVAAPRVAQVFRDFVGVLSGTVEPTSVHVGPSWDPARVYKRRPDSNTDDGWSDIYPARYIDSPDGYVLHKVRRNDGPHRAYWGCEPYWEYGLVTTEGRLWYSDCQLINLRVQLNASCSYQDSYGRWHSGPHATDSQLKMLTFFGEYVEITGGAISNGKIHLFGTSLVCDNNGNACLNMSSSDGGLEPVERVLAQYASQRINGQTPLINGEIYH